MEYTFSKNNHVGSYFVKEAFFPAIIEFSDEELNNYFVEFNYTDTDMFEFSVNPNTKSLKRFTLTLCNHYSFETGPLSIPEYEEGSIAILGPNRIECDTFSAKIYDTGIIIKLSNVSPDQYLKCGQLIFGLSDDNRLNSLLIIDLSAEDIHHVKTELTA